MLLIEEDIEQMLSDRYKMTTCVLTAFIDFFDHPEAGVVDVYHLQETKKLGRNFLPIPGQQLTWIPTNKRCIYFPLCHSNHWILLRFDVSTATLQEMNSLTNCRLDTAINGIANCLQQAFNQPIRIARKTCPQQWNLTDCGFYMLCFLILDAHGYDISDMVSNYATTNHLRKFVRNCLIARSCVGYEEIYNLHRRCSEQPRPRIKKSEMVVQPTPESEEEPDTEQSESEDDYSGEFESGQIPIALANLHESQIEPDYLGKFDLECPYCKALYYSCERPSYNKCCKSGAMILPGMDTPPKELCSLFDYTDKAHASEFHEKIRAINMAFSFASTGEKGLDKRLANMKGGVYVYRINNTIHHFMGSLLPVEGEERKFSQLYIYDNTDDSVAARCKLFPKISSNLMTKIEICLRTNNKFIQEYRQVGKDLINRPNYRMVIRDDFPNMDLRVYNQAAPNQVAGILPSGSNMMLPRDIIIQRTDKKIVRISHKHPGCLPLSYPLLYAKGQPGYSYQMSYKNKNGKNQKVTLRAYVNYHLKVRKNNFNVLHHAGKLFLQWLVDTYCAIESEKLDWFRYNQKTIKADSYRNLVDAHQKAKATKDIG